MWCIRRIEPFTSIFTGKYITLVGSGGKTTLIEYLAAQGSRVGRSVAVTTTTTIFVQEPYELAEKRTRGPAAPGTVLRVGKTVEDGKLTALTLDEVLELGQDFDRVLIEADGSKGLPLKYPAEYEPVIPPFSDQVVVVAGLDGLGGRVDERVFRWELFARASGIDRGAVVTPRVVERLFAGDGVFKGVRRDRAMVILNKYDACIQRSEALGMARTLLAATKVDRVVVSSLRLGIFYGVEADGERSATGIQLA